MRYYSKQISVSLSLFEALGRLWQSTETCPKMNTGCLRKLSLSNFVAPHDTKINSFRNLTLHFVSS